MTNEPVDSYGDVERTERIELTTREILELEKTFDVWGHGVESEEVARNIMSDGFVTSWETIISFTYQFPSYPDGVKRMVSSWDYHGRGYKVIFATPKGMWSSETDHNLAKSETHRFLFDKVQDGDNLRRFGKYKIGSEKIVGFINDSGELVWNESFDGDKLKLDYFDKGRVVEKED